MRDIKYRGVDIKTGEMVFGGGIDSQRDTPIIINHGERYFVDAKTVGQYTGLKDKNSVEIYEGDIIHNSNFTDDCNHMVDMIEDIGQWFMIDTKDGYAEPLCDWLDSSEIIGNIHQNPELLEGKK